LQIAEIVQSAILGLFLAGKSQFPVCLFSPGRAKKGTRAGKYYAAAGKSAVSESPKSAILRVDDTT
jgi:hypothetical protein